MTFSDKGQGIVKWILYGIIILSVLVAAISLFSGFIMDYYWFESVGYLQVFMKNIKYQLALLFSGWAIASICFLLSWRTVKKKVENEISGIGDTVFKTFLLIISFGIGWWLKSKYLIVLKFLHQTPWGTTDPVFSKDLSFFIFTLPAVETILTYIAIISFLMLLISLFAYAISQISLEEEMEETTYEFYPFENIGEILRSWPIIASISALTVVGSIFIWLGRYSYLWQFYPGEPVPTGASYMAVNYLIPYTWIKAFGALLLGALAIYLFTNLDKIRRRLESGSLSSLKKEIVIVIVVFLIFVIIPGTVFGAINTLRVQPNEPGIQRSYIEETIQHTTGAYGLDNISEITYPLSEEKLSAEEMLGSPTVKNARIVDYRPIKVTYEEKQRLRTYYEFHDVDVDRYQIDGKNQLAVISAREMDYQGTGWQNRHLFFTHGFGAVISPANKTRSDGTPVLWVMDIPPKTDYETLQIEEPRIYFGERTNDYAIVRANGLNEFDYPKGENNIQYRYEFDRGISLGNSWKKLIGWLYTGDFNILVSNYVGKDSKILLHRNIQERINKIAPFLKYDTNSHLFVSEKGSLNYLINGITWAQRYPYSYSDAKSPGYLSDSAKAFVKSNTGDVEFYLTKNKDPMIRTYSKIYPNLFKDAEEMSEDYRNHLIYPTSLFDIQMEIFKRYHMKDYQSFYQKEDLWTLAEEKYHGLSKRVEPYNILLDVTDKAGFKEEEREFTLIKPFTPEGKRNMIAWVGIAQDPSNYGKILALMFPKGQLARGPMQVEAIIDQEEEISQRFTLWESAGSEVLRGNLLVLPVKGDILYIEPVYLSAETVPYPQLKRVVAVYRDMASMEGTLEEAITAALGGKVEPEKPEENVQPIENAKVEELIPLIREYLNLREEYYKLISEQKHVMAGKVMENMLDLEEKMQSLIT